MDYLSCKEMPSESVVLTVLHALEGNLPAEREAHRPSDVLWFMHLHHTYHLSNCHPGSSTGLSRRMPPPPAPPRRPKDPLPEIRREALGDQELGVGGAESYLIEALLQDVQ